MKITRSLEKTSLVRAVFIGLCLSALLLMLIVFTVARYTNDFLNRESIFLANVVPNFTLAHQLAASTTSLQAQGLLLRNATQRNDLINRENRLLNEIQQPLQLLDGRHELPTSVVAAIKLTLTDISGLVGSLSSVRQQQLAYEALLSDELLTLLAEFEAMQKEVKQRVVVLTDQTILDRDELMSRLPTNSTAIDVQTQQDALIDFESDSLTIQDYLVYLQDVASLSALLERVALLQSPEAIRLAEQERDLLLRSMVGRAIYIEDQNIKTLLLNPIANARTKLRQPNNIFSLRVKILELATAQQQLSNTLADQTEILITKTDAIRIQADSTVAEITANTVGVIANYRNVLGILVVLLLLLLAVLAYWLIYRLTVLPLGKITARLERVGTPQFTAVGQTSAIKEVDVLEGAVHDLHQAIIASKLKDKQLESRNQQLKQANEDLEQFAHVASHDLQEPLRKLQQFSGLLDEDYRDTLDDDGRYYLRAISGSAKRMSMMIKSTLEYARSSSTNEVLEVVDLNHLIGNLEHELELLILEADAELTVGSLPQVRASTTGMAQLFRNLIANSLKYRNTSRACLVSITSRPSTNTKRVIIEVSDNGIGIPEKYWQRAFKPFERLSAQHADGTGLGLAMCQKVCQSHGWDISVTSIEHEQTTFSISVPMSSIVQ